MADINDCIRRIDEILGKTVEFEKKNSVTIINRVIEFQHVLIDVDTLLKDQKTVLGVPEAMTLVNNLQGICVHFMINGFPEQALDVYRLIVRLPDHIETNEENVEKLIIKLSESWEYLCSYIGNANQLEPFVDVALTARLNYSRPAQLFRSRLYEIKAETLMWQNRHDEAMLLLAEAYSCLVDSVFQGDADKNSSRLGLLRNVRRCLEANDQPRLARWIQQKINIIKSNF